MTLSERVQEQLRRRDAAHAKYEVDRQQRENAQQEQRDALDHYRTFVRTRDDAVAQCKVSWADYRVEDVALQDLERQLQREQRAEQDRLDRETRLAREAERGSRQTERTQWGTPAAPRGFVPSLDVVVLEEQVRRGFITPESADAFLAENGVAPHFLTEDGA